MIQATDLLDEAERLAGTPSIQSEATRRRAVSAANYGLVHAETDEGRAFLIASLLSDRWGRRG